MKTSNIGKTVIVGFLSMAFTVIITNAQYVGIGTTSPSAKLTVSGFETTGNGQNAGIRIINTASSNAWILRAGATGTTTPAGGFSIGDNAAYRMVITNTGNVGIGTVAPEARLHISGGGIKLDGTQSMEFGAGISKEINAGKITYGAYSPNILEITGGGTLASNRSIRFFNEGVAWFAGPLYLESGNITRASSGSTGLLPVAIGNVNYNGGIWGGTGNFSVEHSGTGSYRITFAGFAYDEHAYVAIVTCAGVFNTTSILYTGQVTEGRLGITIRQPNGAGVDQNFHFVLYKL